MTVLTHNAYEITIQSQNPNPLMNKQNSAKLTSKPATHLTLGVVAVTCYFRHLKRFFEKAGIEVTPENKKELDIVIHEIVGVNYKNCPDAWKQVKSLILEDEATFVSKLKDAWENR